MEVPEQKVVAIVSYSNEHHPQLGTLYYQVTIDPKYVHEGFIRFGHHNGDEIMGWRPLATLNIEAILARWDGEKFDPPPMVTP